MGSVRPQRGEGLARWVGVCDVTHVLTGTPTSPHGQSITEGHPKGRSSRPHCTGGPTRPPKCKQPTSEEAQPLPAMHTDHQMWERSVLTTSVHQEPCSELSLETRFVHILESKFPVITGASLLLQSCSLARKVRGAPDPASPPSPYPKPQPPKSWPAHVLGRRTSGHSWA